MLWSASTQVPLQLVVWIYVEGLNPWFLQKVSEKPFLEHHRTSNSTHSVYLDPKELAMKKLDFANQFWVAMARRFEVGVQVPTYGPLV